MRGFLAVPITLLGIAVIGMAAAIDYAGDMLMRLGALVAGVPPNDANQPPDDDRGFRS